MTNASAPPLEGRCRSHDLQRAGVVLDGTHGYSTAADHLGAAVVPEPALESLHIEQAGEALVRCPAHPLAVGLHQGSHEFINSFQVRGAGCPLLWPPLPPAAADEGERPRLVGTDPGIKLLSSPSDPTELRQRAMPGSGSVSRWRSQHVAMPGGPRPRAPSTAAKGAWRIIRRW
jgi:hypothetical protein